METLYGVFVVLHLLSWAIVIGGWLANVRNPRVIPGMAHGAAAALLTGIILVGIAEAADVATINNTKIAVKLVLALIVAVLAFLNFKKPAPNSMAHVVGGLAVVNVIIAVLW